MDRNMFNIHEDAKKYEEYVIGLRQEFHRHPELSDQEVWTSGRICEELAAKLDEVWKTDVQYSPNKVHKML